MCVYIQGIDKVQLYICQRVHSKSCQLLSSLFKQISWSREGNIAPLAFSRHWRLTTAHQGANSTYKHRETAHVFVYLIAQYLAASTPPQNNRVEFKTAIKDYIVMWGITEQGLLWNAWGNLGQPFFYLNVFIYL